jgi:hypothetical protein
VIPARVNVKLNATILIRVFMFSPRLSRVNALLDAEFPQQGVRTLARHEKSQGELNAPSWRSAAIDIDGVRTGRAQFNLFSTFGPQICRSPEEVAPLCSRGRLCPSRFSHRRFHPLWLIRTLGRFGSPAVAERHMNEPEGQFGRLTPYSFWVLGHDCHSPDVLSTTPGRPSPTTHSDGPVLRI